MPRVFVPDNLDAVGLDLLRQAAEPTLAVSFSS